MDAKESSLPRPGVGTGEGRDRLLPLYVSIYLITRVEVSKHFFYIFTVVTLLHMMPQPTLLNYVSSVQRIFYTIGLNQGKPAPLLIHFTNFLKEKDNANFLNMY